MSLLSSLVFIQLALRSAANRRLVQELEIQAVLQQLEREHPELVAQHKLNVLEQKQRDEESRRSAFWLSTAQNALFLVLGFVISYIFAMLHVL
jgi:hypothetical protein